MRTIDTADRRFDTFLSYNSSDHAAVEHLALRLQQEGVQTWLDRWNLIPGNPWQDEIEQALENCVTSCILIGPSGLGPWQNAEMRAAIDRRVSRGDFRVIPVLLPGAQRDQRSRYPAFLTQTTWVEFRDRLDDQEPIRRLVAGIRGRPPGPGSAALRDAGTCPYRGLQVFDVKHADFFFGREALTEWLVDALRVKPHHAIANRFLAIIGASGSGKSSLVRAGLIPLLTDGALPDSENWPVVILKPGADPVESLAIEIRKHREVGSEAGDIGDLKKHLKQEIDRLHLTVRLALSGQPEDRRVVLVVDQFEEVFTLCDDESTRKAFIDGLLYAASEPTGQTIVILTMRADFYGKCAGFEALATELSDHQVLVGQMSELELRDAIVRPANLTGCEFEAGLVEMLLDDVRGEAGGLPLLQYALSQLWERREGRRLTVKAYGEIGRLQGALEKRADEIYNGLSHNEAEVCKQIFLRLTQPGEGTEDTKRRAYREEIGRNDVVDRVLSTLTDARLITIEGRIEQGEPVIEVAHEALIRGWSKLGRWIDDNRDGLRVHARLTHAAREWAEKGRTHPDDYVYRGARLVEVEEWTSRTSTQLSQLERDFVDSSIQCRKKASLDAGRRRRRIAVVVGTVVLLFGAGIGLGTSQYQNARRTSQELAQIQQQRDREIARTDLAGAFTAFGTTYGGNSMEAPEGRGLFTSLLEQHLFEDYVSVPRAIALAQDQLRTKQHVQRAEVVSSLNAELFVKPRNERRQFKALVVGLDQFDNWPALKGAVADAKSIHGGLVKAGYSSDLLLNPSRAEFGQAFSKVITDATGGCKRETEVRRPIPSNRGFVIGFLKPCENVLLFLYFAAHGFTYDGATYVVLRDTEDPRKPRVWSEGPLAVSVDELRGRIAEQVAAQVIIADVSRNLIRLGDQLLTR
jgi:hypothetical protein